jgi:hypothetical protein
VGLGAAVLGVGLASAGEEPSPVDPAAEETAPLEAPADVLSPYRTQFDVLAERTIGTTSRPVEFNWRRTKVQVAVTGSYLVELNNFNSMRGGALVRLPSGGLVVELGATYAGVWDSPSSRQLALTPYRQAGHPNRLEVDFTVGLPLAEGIVTTFPRFFPAVEMVLNSYGGFRYLLYPTGFGGMKAGQIMGALLAPSLTESELDNLDDARLDAMQVDSGRYGLLVGLGNDLYFKSGFFLSPRLMIAVPLLAPATQTELLVWADLSLAVGLAF